MSASELQVLLQKLRCVWSAGSTSRAPERAVQGAVLRGLVGAGKGEAVGVLPLRRRLVRIDVKHCVRQAARRAHHRQRAIPAVVCVVKLRPCGCLVGLAAASSVSGPKTGSSSQRRCICSRLQRGHGKADKLFSKSKSSWSTACTIVHSKATTPVRQSAPHGHQLGEAAGLEHGGHQQHVRGGVDEVAQRLVILEVEVNPVAVLAPQVARQRVELALGRNCSHSFSTAGFEIDVEVCQPKWRCTWSLCCRPELPATALNLPWSLI